VRNPLYKWQSSPAHQEIGGPERNPLLAPVSEVYPYAFTTYRLTEHHTAGGMSRGLPVLSELQPEFFCEVSPELAHERGLEHGGWATIVTARTAVEARVLVTRRIRPLVVEGRTIHQIGLPYHWGGNGLSTGDSANDLLGVALDPNVHIQESKAATCDIRPGRRPRGPALRRLVEDYRRRAAGEEEPA
ncbi:MAG: molybdopterin dinucleotide binding domain-containing protein, partial [Mycobacteriales bacterium]